MIKNRLKNLVIFLITIGLIIILNYRISFSQDADNQNTQNAQLPCKELENCVFLGDQYLFIIYTKGNGETPKERAKNISKTIGGIANNLLIDTNKLFTYQSGTCSIDESAQKNCDAIVAYIKSDGERGDIIKISQEDLEKTNTKETINIKSTIDLANKYQQNIQTKINLYRRGLKDSEFKSIGTIILLIFCFILIFNQLFLNIFWKKIYNFLETINIGIVNFLGLIFKNQRDKKKSLANEEVTQTATECKVGNKTKDGTLIKEVYFRSPDYVIYRTQNTIRWDMNETQISQDNSYHKYNEHKNEKIDKLYIYAILKDFKSLALCIYQKMMLEIRLKILNIYKNEKQEILNGYYNQVQQELSEIESKQPTEIEDTETINIVVAHGIKLALDGEIRGAKEVFKIANQRLDNFRKKYNTLKYLDGSFTVVLCFLSGISLLAILPELFPDFFYNIFTILNISEQFIPVIIFGSLGGFLSVSYRIRSAGLDIRDPDANFRILGASRIYIAVISSIFIYSVLKADIINGTSTSLLDVGNLEMSRARIAFFSAVAGFVEGFIPDILDNSASKFGQNGETNTDHNPENNSENK